MRLQPSRSPGVQERSNCHDEHDQLTTRGEPPQSADPAIPSCLHITQEARGRCCGTFDKNDCVSLTRLLQNIYLALTHCRAPSAMVKECKTNFFNMKRILPLLLLLSLVVFSPAQVNPATDQPDSISVSLPAEMPGKGDPKNVKITLHYREAGTHYLLDYAFGFMLLDERGDQIKRVLLSSNQSTELKLEGTDPVYSPNLLYAQNTPLTPGTRYQLVVVLKGDTRAARLVNVKSFKIAE